MQNETETPSMQSDSLSAGSPHETKGGNGFDSVASQYRAMQEAQLLHEETINQLREEVRGQRERLAELARTSPAQKNGQLDIVMLRLTELERKIGEGAPDPLINEIVHRLASLENAGPLRGAKDPRVDEIQSQLESLRQVLSQSESKDPRTDDLVLRIASLEGAFRRAAQSRDPEEVQARIDSLAQELDARQRVELGEIRESLAELAKAVETAGAADTDHASAAALEELTERLTAIESRLAEPREDGRIADLDQQISELRTRLDGQDLSPLHSRLDALEQHAPQDDAGAAVAGVSERVRAVEERLDNLPVAPEGPAVEFAERIDELTDRLSDLAGRVEESAPAQRLLELSGRVRGIEVRLDATPSPAKAVQELRDQVTRLEQTVSSKPGSADLARLSTELNALRVEAGQSTPEDVGSQIKEIENRIADLESASRLEDADARLSAVEAKLSALGEPAEIGRRLTVLEMDDSSGANPRVEDALHRIAALESKPFETLSDKGLHELQQAVADLRAELEAVSSQRLPELNDLPERLARLEARLDEAAQAAPRDSASSLMVDAVQAQIQALSDRLNELDARPASTETHDPRVSELIARVNWVEQNAAAATQLTSDVDIEGIRRRMEAIEEGLAAGKSSGSLSPGLQAELSARLHSLEQSIEALQERAESNDVDAVATTLHKETDRWSQWARSTMQEISDLRERVESGAPGSVGGGSGLDAESLEALAVQITSTLHTSEVKSLRGQMYFVYLALGVIWALLMYMLFTS